MKRSTVLLVSCLVLAGGSGWLAHIVRGQSAEPKEKEKTYTVTQSQLDKYVADKVAKAVAEEREKGAKPATDDEVLNPLNWHKAIFNKAEYVIYTGPGQIMFHHWVEPTPPKPPNSKSTGAVAEPAPKGG